MDTDYNYFFDFLVNGIDELFSTLQDVSDFVGHLFTFFPPGMMMFLILSVVIGLLGMFFKSIIHGE